MVHRNVDFPKQRIRPSVAHNGIFTDYLSSVELPLEPIVSLKAGSHEYESRRGQIEPVDNPVTVMCITGNATLRIPSLQILRKLPSSWNRGVIIHLPARRLEENSKASFLVFPYNPGLFHGRIRSTAWSNNYRQGLLRSRKRTSVQSLPDFEVCLTQSPIQGTGQHASKRVSPAQPSQVNAEGEILRNSRRSELLDDCQKPLPNRIAEPPSEAA
mmetsp:Transcript_2362/g.3583  ORF Transcript_2362/g.3583 Transcript_2362/m.3583 type:complete len:214 (-) Transcript_2362:76-717(-)